MVLEAVDSLDDDDWVDIMMYVCDPQEERGSCGGVGCCDRSQ